MAKRDPFRMLPWLAATVAIAVVAVLICPEPTAEPRPGAVVVLTQTLPWKLLQISVLLWMGYWASRGLFKGARWGQEPLTLENVLKKRDPHLTAAYCCTMLARVYIVATIVRAGSGAL